MAWGLARSKPEAAAIKQLQHQLDILNQAETTEESKAEYLEVSKKLDDHLLKHEIYWAQRSRISWLKHGDKNTKIFHSKATQWRGKNHIKGIKNAQDQWVEEPEDVVKVALDYFDNLFCAGSCDQMEDCLGAITSKVTIDMQEFLSSDFNAKEIKVALF